ncbi:MAG: oxalyl-CoA decarboxylase [Eggerthellaceae bacterium]|nr:oxalyl-CoA decarboxylase [Eggerthellaceae bacterium]
MEATTQATAPASTATLTDGAHYLVEALIKNGVDKMYGVVGIPVTDFARIAQAKGIRYIGMRHEADAGNAAAAQGFLTGRPGVFLTVSAPGFLNGLAPLKEATENGWPVIMISGESSRDTVDLMEGQYEGLDQRAYAVPFAKAAYRIDNMEDIPLGVARAIRAACSGRPGGVYLSMPDTMIGQTMDAAAAEAALYAVNNPAPAMIPDQASVDQALKLLSEAKNPLIFLGKGAAYAQCDDLIAEFVHKTGIPYQPMSMAKGLIPDDDPQCTASCRGLAMRTADVVLMVGARLNWMLNFGKGRHWNKDVKFIQIDIDPTEIDNSRYIECPVVGDIKSTMQLFVDGLSKYDIHASQEWTSMLDADKAKNNARFGAKTAEETTPLNHYNALGAVKKVMDKNHDVILVNEGANTLDDCRDIVDMYLPRHRLDCGTWGVMGIGTGYAIGAAVTTGKSVLSIHGDSAFGFDGMEVETACRFNLPITFMVLNNGGIYRGDFEDLGASGDPSPLTLDATAHYEKMIEAFGGTGYFATTMDEVESMLTEALASKKPCFINVQLSVHAGVESGHISNLNPIPVVGPLSDSECEDLNEEVVDGKLVQEPASK